MSTCENCGASFEKSERIEEVTSLRVLCPACAAARAAAKARKAAGAAPTSEARSAVPVPAKKLQARDAARPTQPEARPAQPDGRPAQPEVRTARVDARPTPRDSRPVQPQREAAAQPRPRPAQTEHLNDKPPAAAARPALVRDAKPAAKKAPPKKPKIDVDSLASHNLQKRGSREIWIAFAVAVVVFGVAGGVLWKVLNQHKAEAAAAQAIKDRFDNFKATFAAMPLDSEEDALKLIKYGEENREVWIDDDSTAAEVQSRTAKSNTLIETLKERVDLTQRLASLEATLAKAAELAPNDLAEMRRRLDELVPKVPIVGAEFGVRLEKDRADAERVHLERLMAIAETTAATEPLDRAALSTLGQVEDDLFRMLDGTAKVWDKNRGDAALTEKKTELEGKYKSVMKLADEAVNRFYTPEVIEAMPWRDLLADSKAWKATELKGFEHPITGSLLHLIGPDPTEGGQGVMSIGDKEIWRDFVIEMEITILKGRAEFFFRLPLNWQKNVESLELTSTDEGGLEAGRTYSYLFGVVGSTLSQQMLGEEPEPRTDSISWVQIRKGAFGIAIPKETEIKITKLRGKVLR